jgi:hypothetical protein
MARKLDLYGPTKAFIGICAPPASLAYELGILYQLFVIVQAVLDIAHIYQIAQMFIMHRTRHLGFLHFYPSFLFLRIEKAAQNGLKTLLRGFE